MGSCHDRGICILPDRCPTSRLLYQTVGLALVLLVSKFDNGAVVTFVFTVRLISLANRYRSSFNEVLVVLWALMYVPIAMFTLRCEYLVSGPQRILVFNLRLQRDFQWPEIRSYLLMFMAVALLHAYRLIQPCERLLCMSVDERFSILETCCLDSPQIFAS